jgi:hypothetical protein
LKPAGAVPRPPPRPAGARAAGAGGGGSGIGVVDSRSIRDAVAARRAHRPGGGAERHERSPTQLKFGMKRAGNSFAPMSALAAVRSPSPKVTK